MFTIRLQAYPLGPTRKIRTKSLSLGKERFRFGVRRASPLSICFLVGPNQESTSTALALRPFDWFFCRPIKLGKRKANRKRRCSPHSKSKTLLVELRNFRAWGCDVRVPVGPNAFLPHSPGHGTGRRLGSRKYAMARHGTMDRT